MEILTRWDFPVELREIRLGTIALNRQAAETDDVDLVTIASLHIVVEAVDSRVGQDLHGYQLLKVWAFLWTG